MCNETNGNINNVCVNIIINNIANISNEILLVILLLLIMYY